MKEYKVEIITEGALGAIFLGSSKLSESTLTNTLNAMAQQGWEFVFMAIEKRRLGLFWERESAVLTFSRTK